MKNIEDHKIYRHCFLHILAKEVKQVINKEFILNTIDKFVNNKELFGVAVITKKEQKNIYSKLIEKFDYELSMHTIKVDVGITLSDPEKHVDWEKPESNFYWGIHKKFITDIYKKKDPNKWKNILKSIDEETDTLLSGMENPLRKEFDSKGLVIGYVQSGKTANFTALIAKAMDAGYKMIVVLGGMHNSLRIQTQSRLDKELLGYDDYNNQPKNISKYYESNHRKPKRVTKTAYVDLSDETVSDGEFHSRVEKLEELLEIKEKYNKVVAVIKKNVTVLKKINNWIEICPKHIREKTPILIIDDEADQASIDGNYLKNVRQGKNIEENVTETNNQILRMIGNFTKRSFIGYTATPFANCFIDPHYKGLYPHNFIHFLPKPSAYFGAEEIFGDDDIKECYVVTEGVESKQQAGKQIKRDEIPESLNKAIYSFLISFGVRILRNEIDQPMAMLVHIDHLVNTQQGAFKIIKDRISTIETIIHHNTEQSRGLILNFEEQYNYSKVSSEILCDKEGYSRNMFTFSEVMEKIKLHISMIEIKQVHSKSDDELNYALQPDLKVIAVGGNKLSRGLTLEGLMTTYFLRNTALADTLMQMGRFFGFRGGYSDLMKIFCHERILENFSYLIDLESDLRDEVSRYEAEGKTPKDFAPSVRAHASMKPSGRMGNAERFIKAFGSKTEQIKYYDLNDLSVLKSNYESTIEFVNKLDSKYKLKSPKNKTHYGKVFYKVSSKDVVEFLNDFQVDESDINIKNIVQYLSTNNLDLINVCIADLKGGKKKSFGRIGKFSLVNRSRKKKLFNNGMYSIGVLSNPTDLMIDMKTDNEYQRKYPLLVLYRINKDSVARKEANRVDLFEGFVKNEKTDLAGFSITFPKAKDKEFDVWEQIF